MNLTRHPLATAIRTALMHSGAALAIEVAGIFTADMLRWLAWVNREPPPVEPVLYPEHPRG